MFRSAIDFYRARPVLGALLAVVGLALSAAVVVIGADRPVLAVVLAVLVGLLIGVAIGAAQERPD